MSNNYYTQEQIDALGQYIGSQLREATGTTNIKTIIESIPGYNLMSDAEKDKLLSLESSKFLGTFTDSAEIPTENAVPGSYADVESQDGLTIERWIYNASTGAFSKTTSAGGGETASTIKTKYESNDDTNAFTDSHKNIVESLPENIQVATNTADFTSSFQTSLNYIDFSKIDPSSGLVLSNYDPKATWMERLQLNFAVEIDGVVHNETKEDLITLDDVDLKSKIVFRLAERSEMIANGFGIEEESLVKVLEVFPAYYPEQDQGTYEIILKPSQDQKAFSSKIFIGNAYVNPEGNIAFKLNYGNAR